MISDILSSCGIAILYVSIVFAFATFIVYLTNKYF